MNDKTNKLIKHKERLENLALLKYAEEQEKNRFFFNETKRNLILNAGSEKISIISLISIYLSGKVKTLFGKSVSLFVIFMVQFILMYYPFAVIGDFIFKNDMNGLGSYLFLFIADLLFLGIINKYCKVTNHPKVNFIKDLSFEGSKLSVSYDEYKKKNFIDNQIQHYVNNKMPFKFKKDLLEVLKEKDKNLSNLNYEELFYYIDSSIMNIN